MVMDRHMTYGFEHTICCTNDMLCNSAPRTCIILLTSVIPINSKKEKRYGIFYINMHI